MSARRVAACVVTGFLGSGKTTLLRALLEREPERDRIAVIVNEVGEIGIDGRVLGGFEYVENVVELASGCICCSIDEYRFDLAVDELVRRLDPLLLVLETSGVADPQPAVERLRRCGIGVDAVVTVVDATNWRIAWGVSRAARRQVAAADFLVVSKTDLATPPQLARLRRRLAAVNPRALLLESSGGGGFAGGELLLATSAARVARPGPPAAVEDADAAHGADAIASFAWTATGSIERAALVAALEALPRRVLRAKGLFRAAGDGRCWLFQLVCGRVELSLVDAALPPEVAVQAVFLGPRIDVSRERIVASLEALLAPEAAITG